MFNPSLFKKVQEVIAENPDKRVLPLSFDGMNYFIKRRMSNGRNAFAKQNPSSAFWCEAYKITMVNSRLPLAPKIVLFDEDFFVMENVGRPLQSIAKGEEYIDVRLDAFTKAGEGLARLHAAGLHHGRPALRDIAYNLKTKAITLLDWENEKKFIHAPAAVLDLFLFIHSCFREKWSDSSLLDAALTGYTRIEGSRRTIKGLKNLVLDYNTLFYLCHILTPFGWIDVVSVDKTRSYISRL